MTTGKPLAASARARSNKRTAVQEPTWEQVAEWDRKYGFHAMMTAEEVSKAYRCVERVDEQYIYYSDGSKVLDLMSGALSAGFLWHPKVAAAIKEACDSFGFFAEGNVTK